MQASYLHCSQDPDVEKIQPSGDWLCIQWTLTLETYGEISILFILYRNCTIGTLIFPRVFLKSVLVSGPLTPRMIVGRSLAFPTLRQLYVARMPIQGQGNELIQLSTLTLLYTKEKNEGLEKPGQWLCRGRNTVKENNQEKSWKKNSDKQVCLKRKCAKGACLSCCLRRWHFCS